MGRNKKRKGPHRTAVAVVVVWLPVDDSGSADLTRYWCSKCHDGGLDPPCTACLQQGSRTVCQVSNNWLWSGGLDPPFAGESWAWTALFPARVLVSVPVFEFMGSLFVVPLMF